MSVFCIYLVYVYVFSDNVAARIDIKIQNLYASLDVYLVD